ncbi:MAG: D-glycero-alpha-D-manno-heptose-1,7-bisphosphate 7-phosphatase [Candidatus Nanohaloarchaea archaeon]
MGVNGDSGETVFLDRDGVINPLVETEAGEVSPQSIEEFKFFSGVPDAIERLKDEGYRVIVFTNQPDVSKDWRPLDETELEKMNRKLREAGVDAVYACIHGPMGDSEEERSYSEDGEIVVCDCRKPQPGLLEEAAWDFEVDVSSSYVVGDSEKDLEAARRFEEETGSRFAGRLEIGVSRGIGDAAFGDLEAAVEYILEKG